METSRKKTKRKDRHQEKLQVQILESTDSNRIKHKLDFYVPILVQLIQ